jgi:hypothetical protein
MKIPNPETQINLNDPNSKFKTFLPLVVMIQGTITDWQGFVNVCV